MSTDISFTTKTVKAEGNELALVDRLNIRSGNDIADISDPRQFKSGSDHRKYVGEVKLSDFYKNGDSKISDWFPNFYYTFGTGPNYDIPTEPAADATKPEIRFSDFYGAKHDIYTGIASFNMVIGTDSGGTQSGGYFAGGFYDDSASDWNTGQSWWGDLGSASDNSAGLSNPGSGYTSPVSPSICGMGSSNWRISGIVSERITPSQSGSQGANVVAHTMSTYVYFRFQSSTSNATNSGWTSIVGRSTGINDTNDDDIFDYSRSSMSMTKAGNSVRYKITGQVAPTPTVTLATYNFHRENYAPLEFTSKSHLVISLQ